MGEISFEYWNKLANQTILVSSLLSGFSITVVANLLVAELNNRLTNRIMMFATFAAISFLITLFGMTNLLLMTTEGYPIPVVSSDLFYPRVIGSIFFFLGIVSLIVTISLSGWTKSKKMGRFTTALGILAFILILSMVVT